MFTRCMMELFKILLVYFGDFNLSFFLLSDLDVFKLVGLEDSPLIFSAGTFSLYLVGSKTLNCSFGDFWGVFCSDLNCWSGSFSFGITNDTCSSTGVFRSADLCRSDVDDRLLTDCACVRGSILVWLCSLAKFDCCLASITFS